MKTATIPSIRVNPQLRHAAENVLQEGESLSSFVVQSLQANIEHRRLQNEFISRGLGYRDEARKSGEYFTVDDVLGELDDMLFSAAKK